MRLRCQPVGTESGKKICQLDKIGKYLTKKVFLTSFHQLGFQGVSIIETGEVKHSMNAIKRDLLMDTRLKFKGLSFSSLDPNKEFAMIKGDYICCCSISQKLTM